MNLDKQAQSKLPACTGLMLTYPDGQLCWELFGKQLSYVLLCCNPDKYINTSANKWSQHHHLCVVLWKISLYLYWYRQRWDIIQILVSTCKQSVQVSVLYFQLFSFTPYILMNISVLLLFFTFSEQACYCFNALRGTIIFILHHCVPQHIKVQHDENYIKHIR